MFRRTALSTAIVVAMGASAGSTLAIAEEQEVEKLEKIQVTGSRISRVDVEGPTPVMVFDRDMIESSGAATIAEFLRESPTLMGPNMVTENETLTQVAGASGLNYRGFGQDAVLVLLNGRRLPDNPISSTFVDINQLPSAAVQRIEVLNDGASAIYGSDAVAGVINIITRTEYEGATVNFRKGVSSENDGGQDTLSIVTGTSTENSRVLVTFDAFKQDIVKATDREMSKSAVYNGFDGRSSYGYPASIFKTDFSQGAAPAGCDPKNIVPSDNADSGTECKYDFASDYQLVPETERYGAFGLYEYDFNEAVTGYAQLRYAYSKTKTSNAPAPGFLKVKVTDDYLPYVNGLDGVGVGDDIFVARRWIEFGNREKDNINKSAEGILGLKGSMEGLPIADDLNWTFEVGHSETKGTQKGTNGQLYSSQMTSGVASGDINPFDPSKNSAETVAKYQQSPEREGKLRLSFANLRADGYLDDLALGWAYGLEARQESYYDKVTEGYDDIIGGASGNGKGDRKVKATYLELSHSPIDILELGAAVRYDKYSDFGNATTGKVSAGLRPVDELLLRASISTGFKAPDLKELYLGQSTGVQKAIDTKSCNAAKAAGKTTDEINSACRKKEIASTSGGNPDLKAEKSESYNLGFVWSITDDLSASVDYWDITVEDKITTIGIQEILNNEDQFGDLIQRSPAGTLGGKESGSLVTDTYQNVAEERGKGVDISVRYSFPTDIGDFGVRWDTSHLLSFKRSKGVTGKQCEEAGTYGEPQWKSSVALDWSRNAWNGNATVKYIGDYNDNGQGRLGDSCKFSNANKVASYTTLDLQLGYAFDFGTKVNVGVKNVGNEKPPFSAEEQWPWYNQGLYSPVGRFFYLDLKHTF